VIERLAPFVLLALLAFGIVCAAYLAPGTFIGACVALAVIGALVK
jgi:hypothetical protein